MDYIIVNLLETRIYIYRLVYSDFVQNYAIRFAQSSSLFVEIPIHISIWWLDGDSPAQKFQQMRWYNFSLNLLTRTSTQISLHQVVLLIYICNELSHKTMVFFITPCIPIPGVPFVISKYKTTGPWEPLTQTFAVSLFFELDSLLCSLSLNPKWRSRGLYCFAITFCLSWLLMITWRVGNSWGSKGIGWGYLWLDACLGCILRML